MSTTKPLYVPERPSGIDTDESFVVEVRPLLQSTDDNGSWTKVPTIATEVAKPNPQSNTFHRHTVSIVSFDMGGPVEIRARYTRQEVTKASIRPLSRGIDAVIVGDTVSFTLEKPLDVMLELNGDKYQALHVLANGFDSDRPTGDDNGLWYFGPGVNNGTASSRVTDGVNLNVPSNTTVYLASGAFITFRLNFLGVSNSSVRGHGFICSSQGGFKERELGGAIHMNGARDILVEKVTSLGANGYSLSAGECSQVRVDGYRSFTSAGNGDGIDFFCSSDITIENCFLRNSDDNIALYSHRWDWYGDSENITIRNCVLLPDIAHPINMGTHGNPAKPETTRNVTISNIDILDHEENQLWYQGCIAINATDRNLFCNIHVENVRVERITKGQLFNLRVMLNTMYATAPGRGIRDVTFKNISLNLAASETVNPSQILGYDGDNYIENVTFENLKIGDSVICTEMQKPYWYMVEDFVPVFVNEHVKGLTFTQKAD
ncbi:hypothetical protein PFICI_04733 [Pestalotiopsis fici W106-1]|uniref:Uncharacterized protein n=1 Tax=Pestalotiopsis fici (strain W106-1 / CGMCC3.15140) TaxID=1229662 RepID=W3XBQ4_PESFW|nr:uncharacterized protein PFICI_04733 [Pestalotiopsis fici W106-1]ETS82857.1 hypothetical protein PFICI_04733 [Pestalotiopsis fici W106-1]